MFNRLFIVGWLFLPGFIIMTIRLTYEKTYLTWKKGPQLVGFHMMHSYPFLSLFCMISELAAMSWLIGMLIYFGIKRPPLRWHGKFLLILTIITAIIANISDNLFQKMISWFAIR